jgi:tetraacyldisaccharide 4'-kinase
MRSKSVRNHYAKPLERIWWNKESKPRSLLEPVLAVASIFYRFGLGLDQWNKAKSPKRLPRPVFSVGNLTVGGTGKTPVALWLAEQAILLGKSPCLLTRGYGSKGKGPRKVDPACKDWREYGDEPLLMARRLSRGAVYVGGDRYGSGQAALGQEKEIDLFILDDGFQHRRLTRDYDLVLVDGEREFGNGRLLPWGPMREPLEALERASAVGRVWRSGRFESSQQILSKPAGLNLGIGLTGWRYLGAGVIRWRNFRQGPAPPGSDRPKGLKSRSNPAAFPGDIPGRITSVYPS